MFCLASAGGAGLLFLQVAHEPLTSIYSGLSAVHAIIRQKRQNRLQGFTAAFPLICPIPAHTIQQIHKPPIHRLRSAGGHTIKRSISTDTRRTATPDAVQGRAAAYYNNVYRNAPVGPAVNPCPAGQNSADHASGGGTIGGLPPHFFSGFRPIANRGQQ